MRPLPLFAMTPEERATAFPKGTLVRVKLEQVESFNSNEASRLKDRVGLVFGHTAFSSHPIVRFPALGRRSEHSRSFMFAHMYLDVLTDKEEVAHWMQVWAQEKVRIEKVLARKRAAYVKANAPV